MALETFFKQMSKIKSSRHTFIQTKYFFVIRLKPSYEICHVLAKMSVDHSKIMDCIERMKLL